MLCYVIKTIKLDSLSLSKSWSALIRLSYYSSSQCGCNKNAGLPFNIFNALCIFIYYYKVIGLRCMIIVFSFYVCMYVCMYVCCAPMMVLEWLVLLKCYFVLCKLIPMFFLFFLLFVEWRNSTLHLFC